MLILKVIAVLDERKLLDQLLESHLVETALPGTIINQLIDEVLTNKNKLSDQELLAIAKTIISAYLANNMLYKTLLLAINKEIDDIDNITIQDILKGLIKKCKCNKG